MVSPHFPASSWIALRGIALFPEIHQNRRTFRLCIPKPRQFLEADAVHIMRRNFPILIQHDHIADRQAMPMVIRRAGAVEFLIQLFQQLRIRKRRLHRFTACRMQKAALHSPAVPSGSCLFLSCFQHSVRKDPSLLCCCQQDFWCRKPSAPARFPEL